MGTPGEDAHIQQRGGPASGQHPPAGQGIPSLRVHGHFLAVRFAAAQGQSHLAGVLLHDALHQGTVMLFHFPGGQLPAEFPMGKVVLGHQQQAGGILVQPVDNPRADLPANARKAVQVIQQGIDQGALLIARGGMHHHAAGLHHHGQVLILIQDFQVNILRLWTGLPGRRLQQRQERAGGGFGPRLGQGCALQRAAALLHQRRHPAPA